MGWFSGGISFILLNIFIQDQSMAPSARFIRRLPVSQVMDIYHRKYSDGMMMRSLLIHTIFQFLTLKGYFIQKQIGFSSISQCTGTIQNSTLDIAVIFFQCNRYFHWHTVKEIENVKFALGG